MERATQALTGMTTAVVALPPIPYMVLEWRNMDLPTTAVLKNVTPADIEGSLYCTMDFAALPSAAFYTETTSYTAFGITIFTN